MKYKSKPVVIEAFQWGDFLNQGTFPDWFKLDLETMRVDLVLGSLFIKTLEGTMEARPGDWIIKGTEGEFYPCRDSVFKTKYELVEE